MPAIAVDDITIPAVHNTPTTLIESGGTGGPR
jgi:hypothetical protein